MDAIRRGEKTQTLRNWKSQRLHTGQKETVPGIGPIWIDSVEKVALEDLTDEDAIPDGFPTIDALKAEILNIYGDEPEGDFYRVRFHILKADPGDPSVPGRKKQRENSEAGPPQTQGSRKNSSLKTGSGSKPKPRPDQIAPELLVPQSREYPAILNFVKEIKKEFAEEMKKYLNRIESQNSIPIEEEPEILTEAQVVEKMVQRCRVNRCVCDWNHEPCKSKDFFSLFLRSPRDERGIPTLDGYRLRSLMRDFCTEDQWEEINWIATEICGAWTEWQYAVEHWNR